MPRLLIILITFLLLSTAGIYLLNEAFKQMNLDIGSGLSLIFSSLGQGESQAQSLEIGKINVDTTTYNRFFNDKAQMEEAFESSSPLIDELNNNTEFTSAIRSALGDYYSIYIFTFVEEPIVIKIFEWTLVLENGLVTVSGAGELVDSPFLEVEVGHELAQQMIAGDVTQEDLINWVMDGQITVRPIFEVFKLIQLAPTILESLQLEI